MIYNYRFDRDLLTQILQRLRAEQVLSQGWGGGNEANLNVANADFVTRCTSYYKLATTRVPSNLTRMRDLKRGDLLVVPHLPEYGKVSIHVGPTTSRPATNTCRATTATRIIASRSSAHTVSMEK